MTKDELGNQHGYQCPKCKSGEYLSIKVMRWVELVPDGTEDQGGDTEWDGPSEAECRNCFWSGSAMQLLVVELED